MPTSSKDNSFPPPDDTQQASDPDEQDLHWTDRLSGVLGFVEVIAWIAIYIAYSHQEWAIALAIFITWLGMVTVRLVLGIGWTIGTCFSVAASFIRSWPELSALQRLIQGAVAVFLISGAGFIIYCIVLIV